MMRATEFQVMTVGEPQHEGYRFERFCEWIAYQAKAVMRNEALKKEFRAWKRQNKKVEVEE